MALDRAIWHKMSTFYTETSASIIFKAIYHICVVQPWLGFYVLPIGIKCQIWANPCWSTHLIPDPLPTSSWCQGARSRAVISISDVDCDLWEPYNGCAKWHKLLGWRCLFPFFLLPHLSVLFSPPPSISPPIAILDFFFIFGLTCNCRLWNMDIL